MSTNKTWVDGGLGDTSGWTKPPLVQLAGQIGTSISQLTGKSLNTECFISFMDDDFTNDVIMDWMIDVFKSKGVPLNVAVITSLADASKIVRMKKVQETGGNVCSHTVNHVSLGTITDEATLRTEILDSATFIKSNGFDNVMVYPYGTINSLGEKIIREAYDFAIGTQEAINDKKTPYSNFLLKRISGIGESGITLQNCKDKVLEAKTSGGWLIFKQHAKNDWSEQTKQDLIYLIDYIKEQGVKIVSVREAFEKKKNPIDVASETGEYFRTSQYGLVDWSEMYWRKVLNTNKLDTKGSALDFDTPITGFENGTTNMYFRNADVGLGKGEPVIYAGVLQTHRPIPVSGNGDYGAYQLYHPYNSNNLYKRRWDVGTVAWTSWAKIIDTGALNSFIMNTSTGVDNTTLITSFPALSCSVHNFRSTDAKGFPVNYGTLKTFRMNNDLGSFQEYIDITKNLTYTRTWNGSWGAWVMKPNIRQYGTASVDFGTIPAQGIVEVTVALTGCLNTSNYVINPVNGMNANVLVFCTSSANDSVAIRVFNATASPLAFSRYFRITEILNFS